MHTCGVVYGAQEAHNLLDRVRLPAPQQANKMDHKPIAKKLYLLIIAFLLLILSFLAFRYAVDTKKLVAQLNQARKLKCVYNKTKTLKFPKIENWKTFKSKDGSFSFKYPASWYLKDEGGFVTVASHPNQCRDCTDEEAQNYFEFAIRNNGILSQNNRTTNALEYLLRDWLDFIEKEKKRCATENPCLPIIPGFTQKYKDDANYLFKNQKASAVEVSFYYPSPDYGRNISLVKNEYLVVTPNYRRYEIFLISPGYSSKEDKPTLEDTKHPLIQILRSLKLK